MVEKIEEEEARDYEVLVPHCSWSMLYCKPSGQHLFLKRPVRLHN
jgi:hypothetical protein